MDCSCLIADVKSGVSGAGRKESLATQLCEASENFKAYSVPGHRHLPEIREQLERAGGGPVGLTFVPHLTPMVRGIHATGYARLIDPGVDLQGLFSTRYEDEPFVDVLPAGSHPETRSVRGANVCRIAWHRPQDGDMVVVLVVEDNLVKGAAGQAIQNMNLMLGLPETDGLERCRSDPMRFDQRIPGLQFTEVCQGVLDVALGRMSVRERRPLREALYFGFVVFALGVAVYLAYANGRATSAMQHLSASTERDRLVGEVDRLETQRRGLRERIAVLERTGQIERKAYADVDEHLKDLEDEIFDLKEEVAFYRDIVSAQRNKGLNIQSLDILPVGSGSDYRYRLVLTKDMRNDKVVTGKVNLSVEGEYDGKSKRLPFLGVIG